ncbi:MAG: RNA polymerase sigma factor [Pirellulaceae bacterium]
MPREDRYADYLGPDGSTTHSLLDAMSNGDDTAWERIALVWGPALVQYFRSRDLQEADIEEVVQNTLLRMYQGLVKGQFERNGETKRLTYWVYAIAANELKTYYTRFLNKPNSLGGSTYQQLLANVETEEEATTLESLAVTQVLQLIEADFQKSTWDAFHLRYFDNYALSDIGRKLGISESSVRQGIYRVRQRLKQELMQLDLFADLN